MYGNQDGQGLLHAAEPLRTVDDSPCVRHLLARIGALDTWVVATCGGFGHPSGA